jgi:hypothetical protein
MHYSATVLYTDCKKNKDGDFKMNENETERVVLQVMETVLELELRAVRQALGEEKVPASRPRRGRARSQSIVDQCISILTDLEAPTHVNDLVTHLRERFGRVTDRDTVSSALAKKARQGILLKQTAPATFALLQEDAS